MVRCVARNDERHQRHERWNEPINFIPMTEVREEARQRIDGDDEK